MKNKRVTCEKRIYTETVTEHHHEHGQFLFPLSGSMNLKTMDQQIKLTPDYCFYLAPYTDHIFHSAGRNEFLVLDIPERMLPEQTDDMYTEMTDEWSAVKHLLAAEINRSDNASAIANLTNYITGKLKTEMPVSIDYINKNYKQRLTLETLAAIENYHPVYYSKWFKKETGKSVKVYINELRLNEAENMLTGTDWSITRIAAEMDFENISSFTRWFVKNKGMPPHIFKELKKC